MRRSFILLCVLSRVSLEMQAVHNFYMRKERSYSPPVHSGYVYNQINNRPSTIITFGDKGDREKQFWDKNKNENTSEKLIPTTIEKIENAEVKKYSLKQDILLKEHENKPSNIVPTYKKKEFRNDEEDVRTELSNTKDGWPLFYHSPYDYEPMKFYNEIEKAQDKRFIVPEDRRVIPVHEHVKDDITDNQIYSTAEFTYSTDNPFFGDQPFFSYVLNDYFDKTDDEDPSSFKGLAWGKDFDQEMTFYDIDDYAKRIRRLEDDPPSHKKVYGAETELDKDSLLLNSQDDNYDSNDSIQAFKDNTNINKQNSHSYNNYNGENNRGFKNFADYFANRFGSEDHNNNLKHNVKSNVDKGEKKNGIRKVYHKDEYQEHTEFHDNNDKKDDYESKGESKIHIGGSEAFLNSQATAATGNDNIRIGNSEDKETENLKKNNKSKLHKRNYDHFGKYRDVAKTAALINNADYIDRFMT